MLGDKWIGIGKVISDRRRRQLLVALMEQTSRDTDEISPLEVTMDSETESEQLQVELRHNHLPTLEKWDYIEWDRERGTISKGPRWDEIAPLLDLITSHQEKLPDGWV